MKYLKYILAALLPLTAVAQKIPVIDSQGVSRVSTLSGDATINSTGVLTLGTVAVGKGGTGLTTFTVGDLIYASGTTTLSKLAGVATGNVLISSGVSNAPQYSKVTVSHIDASSMSGSGILATTVNPIFTTPNLGTPSALVLTNATGLPIAGGGTGASTAAGARTNLGVKSLIKTSDQTKTSDTSPAADSALTFAVSASTNYDFRFIAYISTPDSATPDIKWGISGPASPTGITVYHQVWVGTLLTASGGADSTAYNTGFSANLTDTSLQYVLICEGSFRNGLNAGNLALHWSQNSSSADRTIVKAGSFVRYTVGD